MRWLYFTALFLFAYAVHASPRDSGRLRAPFAIYLMPTQLLNISYASGFTVGAEFPIAHRLGLTAEAGNFYTNGFMGKVNLKYYIPFAGAGKNSACYFALEYAYKTQSYNVTDRLKDPPETPVEYNVYKFVNTANMKFGRVVSSTRSWYMDGYFGLGIRYRVVHNSLNGADKYLYHWHEGFIDNFTNSNDNGFAPSISLGWKIGYRYK